ncbi:MAG: sensor histidine kinase [Firmicutes bacterium]|nr:sensor histidine kinase [Bacillota bacterium]
MGNQFKDRFLFLLLSLFVHLVVLTGYWWGGLWRRFPVSWSYSYTIGLLILMALSIFMPFIASVNTRFYLLMFRFFMGIILAVPTASSPDTFGLMYFLFAFEGFVYLQSWSRPLPGLFSLGISTWLAYLRIPLWGRPPDPVNLRALGLAWTDCLVGAVVGYHLAHLLRVHDQEARLIKELRRTNTYLANTNMNLQDLAAQAELSTMVRERTRVAREIHDTIAYTLTNLISLLDAYRERLQAQGEIISEELDQARPLARDGLADVRAVLRGLRPRSDEGYNGLGNIMRLVEVFRQATGVEVHLSYGDAPQFPGETLEAVFYRAVQEGLTNAFRHGRATQIFVSFCRIREGIELTVRDNGEGATAVTGGFGLLGIRERVEELGGAVTIVTQPGCGFTLRVWLPLPKEGEVNEFSSAGDRGRSEAVSGES